MNEQEYSDYRLRVLAKTKGSDVHVVNGLLGNALNSMKFNDLRYIYDSAVRKIAKITGVTP